MYILYYNIYIYIYYILYIYILAADTCPIFRDPRWFPSKAWEHCIHIGPIVDNDDKLWISKTLTEFGSSLGHPEILKANTYIYIYSLWMSNIMQQSPKRSVSSAAGMSQEQVTPVPGAPKITLGMYVILPWEGAQGTTHQDLRNMSNKKGDFSNHVKSVLISVS